jgi:hypothetical protein
MLSALGKVNAINIEPFNILESYRSYYICNFNLGNDDLCSIFMRNMEVSHMWSNFFALLPAR